MGRKRCSAVDLNISSITLDWIGRLIGIPSLTPIHLQRGVRNSHRSKFHKQRIHCWSKNAPPERVVAFCPLFLFWAIAGKLLEGNNVSADYHAGVCFSPAESVFALALRLNRSLWLFLLCRRSLATLFIVISILIFI